MRIGSLFSGAGGLDLAVQQVFGGDIAWHSENDPAAAKVLAHHWPAVPNHGDITTTDWAVVEPVDILCGGFPCQDLSAAGRRAGIKHGTRSGLWAAFADTIAALQPPIVVIENVRGILSAAAHRDMERHDPIVGDGPGRPVLRALGAVLGDLSDLGYDAQWATVAASDIGTPHRRERVFVVAYPAEQFGACQSESDDGAALDSSRAETGNRDRTGDSSARVQQLGRGAGTQWPVADSPRHEGRVDDGDLRAGLLPTPNASDWTGGGQHPQFREGHSRQLIDYVLAPERWGRYAPAIHRWEQLTRPAPPPTEPNTRGNPRLNPQFSEWMMGWPQGWVTHPDIGISRNDQLKIIGNGVIPQQAIAALRYLLAVGAAA